MSATRTLLLLAALLVALAGASVTKSVPQPRTVGSSATHISKVPFVVSVRRRLCSDCTYQHYCGGTIYSRTVIITGANCVRHADVRNTQIVAGTTYLSGAARDGGVYPVAKITLHEEARIDLAIIHLELPLTLNNFNTKAVTLATELPRAGKKASVAGWGQVTETDAFSESLKEFEVPIIELAVCRSIYYWTEVTDNEICAGYAAGGRDACQGDAGSPLLNLDNQMIGLVSWGYGCARPNNPGVYTNIVNLRSWITTHA